MLVGFKPEWTYALQAPWGLACLEAGSALLTYMLLVPCAIPVRCGPAAVPLRPGSLRGGRCAAVAPATCCHCGGLPLWLCPQLQTVSNRLPIRLDGLTTLLVLTYRETLRVL